MKSLATVCLALVCSLFTTNPADAAVGVAVGRGFRGPRVAVGVGGFGGHRFGVGFHRAPVGFVGVNHRFGVGFGYGRVGFGYGRVAFPVGYAYPAPVAVSYAPPVAYSYAPPVAYTAPVAAPACTPPVTYYGAAGCGGVGYGAGTCGAGVSIYGGYGY